MTISPGEVLRAKINALGITDASFAAGTKLNGATVSLLCTGKQPITPHYAMILAKVFSTTPQYWMYLQADWELAKHNEGNVRGRLKTPDAVAKAGVFE